jgi:hypothetical protein
MTKGKTAIPFSPDFEYQMSSEFTEPIWRLNLQTECNMSRPHNYARNA